MIFKELEIKGVYLITPEPYSDNRGVFRRHFCGEEFSRVGLPQQVLQANISENNLAYTLRGFHYQKNPFSEAKTLSCLRGNIYDIVVDLRTESTTYMKWISINLNSENRKSIHIPQGCANAFLTLEEKCIIHYYCSQRYNSEFEKGIRYNDPAFNFKWPKNPAVISEKDLNFPDFEPI
jgi:dTDP-4-dehydrorhamnose 3,5-epimerase